MCFRNVTRKFANTADESCTSSIGHIPRNPFCTTIPLFQFVHQHAEHTSREVSAALTNAVPVMCSFYCKKAFTLLTRNSVPDGQWLVDLQFGQPLTIRNRVTSLVGWPSDAVSTVWWSVNGDDPPLYDFINRGMASQSLNYEQMNLPWSNSQQTWNVITHKPLR